MNLRLDPLLLLLALLCVGATFMGGMIATAVRPLASGIGPALITALDGQDLPTFSHALLGLLIGIGCIWMVTTRRVVQLPQTRVLSPLLFFLGLVGASVLVSRFQGPSLVSAAEWLLYGLAFLFASAAMGRKQGPVVIVGTLFGSILYLASLGLREWKQSPEGWRIFALWTPNTQASVQIVGIFLALGLLLSRTKATPEELRERAKDGLNLGWLTPFFAVLGLALMGFALLLTGSKGGMLALVAGALFLGVSLLAQVVAPKMLPWIGRAAMLAVAVVCLVPGLISKVPDVSTLKQESKPAAAGALSRIQNAGSTSEQSVGFRKLLWISAYRILKENPLGTGMGTFIFHSAQPGLITQTQTAHNSLLQLTVEAGPLALIALLAFLAFWMESVMRSSPAEPKPRSRMRLAVTAAATALLFHAATESNLYSFGLGLMFFVLLAIASQLSADGVSPEFVPKPGKAIAGLIAACAVLLLLGKGWAEVSRSNLKFSMMQRDVEAAKSASDTLMTLAPEDSETWNLHANLQPSEDERAKDIQRAIDRGPLPRYFRSLAQFKLSKGDLTGAQSTLKESFLWDPNNLPAHLLFLKSIDADAHPEELAAAAQKLVDIEKTPYFQIRSIPEIVPTETLSARSYLARLEKDPNKKAQLLREEVAGFQEYLRLTVPLVKGTLAGDPTGSLSPEPLDKVNAALTEAQEAAKQLGETEKSLGHLPEAAEADRAGAAFAEAFASLFK